MKADSKRPRAENSGSRRRNTDECLSESSIVYMPLLVNPPTSPSDELKRLDYGGWFAQRRVFLLAQCEMLTAGAVMQ